jgi:hypothetical protein
MLLPYLRKANHLLQEAKLKSAKGVKKGYDELKVQ